jgi:hypothetical protein
MDKYVVLHIEGGIGKNVIATAVIRAIQKKYKNRKIVVLTAYPDIFELNPRVYKTYQFGQTSYFYQEYIENKDTIVMSHDPYRESDYVYRRKHLSQIWCDIYGLDWDGEQPELYFTQLESEFVQTLINKDKPVFLINAFGGAVNQQHKYSWARDIPPVLAQEIVDEASKYYRVIQVRREDQIALKNCEYLSMSIRQLALALFFSDRRLLIDSYLQHAAAALNLPSVVLWSCNSPKVFGYKIHTNISSNFKAASLKNSLYDAYDIAGDPIQLATPPGVMFNKQQILKALNFDTTPLEVVEDKKELENI